LYLAQTLGLPAYIRSLKKKDSSASDEVQPSASATSDGSIQPEVGSRDHPANIRIRMKAVITATGLSLAGIYWVVKDLGHYSWQQAVRLSAQDHSQ
jgi:prenyl protein peptidase